MSDTPKKTTSKVAGGGKSSKYITLAMIVVIAVILAQGFFHSSSPTVMAPPTPVTVANNDSTPLNLNFAVESPPPAKPVVPPQQQPRSVLQFSSNAPALNLADDQSRLKSPTQIFAMEPPPPETSLNGVSAGGNANSAFAQQAASAVVATASAKQEMLMDYKILQGKTINAVLETGIQSDLPGMVRGIISKDIYSDTGRYVLLPRGTRLVGMYNSSITAGQTRIMVVWTRAITPQHIDIALGSPGTDSLGRAGMSGIVDNHFWQVFGDSAMLSILGAAGSNVNTGASANSAGIANNPYQAAVTQGMLNSSGNILQSRMNIQPTIHVPQGSAIQVFVARDLDFSTLLAGSSS